MAPPDEDRPWWQPPAVAAPGVQAGGIGPGTSIGGYRVDAVAGQGGMGVVCRATQVALDRTVALKVIAPGFAGDPTFRHRFGQECRLAASLDHPHIIPIIEAGEQDGLLFVSMRWVDGVDLRRLVADEGPLEVRRALGIMTQVASALDAAHAAGLVHRDVKPANILLESRNGADHAYLCDFGLVKRMGADPGLTGSHGWIGTVDYVAPEQVLGDAVGVPADIYALGGVLYTVLSGQVPFPRPDIAGRLYACVNDPLPALGAIRQDLPAGLDEVLALAMAKDPTQRYQSAGDLVGALHHAVATPTRPLVAPTPTRELPGPAVMPDPVAVANGPTLWPAPAPASISAPAAPEPLAGPHRRRRRVAAALATATAVVGVGLVGVALASGGGHGKDKPAVVTGGGRTGQSVPGGASGGVSVPGGQPGLAPSQGSGATRTFDVVTNYHGTGPDHYRVTIYDLRRTGPFITLDLGIVCENAPSPDDLEPTCNNNGTDFAIAPLNDPHGGTSNTIGGIRLIDPAAAKEYEVVRDSQNRAFASGFDLMYSGPTIYQAWGKYTAPPPSVTSMDVFFPDGGPAVANIPIVNSGPPSPTGKVSGASAAPFDRPAGSTDATGLTLPVNDLVSSVGNPTAYTSQAAQQTTVTLSADVLFDFAKSDLTPAAQGVLTDQATRIKSGATGTVTVTGYTDAIGPDSINTPLSQARAQAVLAALTAGASGAPVTFQAAGKGSADPVAPNTNKGGSDNPQGRALNRRVTITYTANGHASPPPPTRTTPPASHSGPTTVVYHHDDGSGTNNDFKVTANNVTRSGQYALANLTITCTGSSTSSANNNSCDGFSTFAAGSGTVPPQAARYGQIYRTDQETVSAIYLTDSTGAQYAVVRTSAGGTMTGEVPQEWSVGTTLNVWLLFPAPPSSVNTTTIDLPDDAAQIIGVPITAGS